MNVSGVIYTVFLLAIYGVVIYCIYFTLRKKGVSQWIAIFASFALFGIGSGLLAALDGYTDSPSIFNIIGAHYGEEVYIYAIDHYGDPHSVQAHYTISWILRTPQIYFFTSAVLFSSIGLVAQILFNLIKKTPPVKFMTYMVVILLLLVTFGISSGVVYAKYYEDNAYPTKVSIVPASEAVTRDIYEEWQTWDIITSYEISSLSFSPEVGQTAHEVMVSCIVENTGTENGCVVVELEVDGVSGFNEIYLLPAESKTIEFFVIFPEEGTYMVRMDNLSKEIEVVAD